MIRPAFLLLAAPLWAGETTLNPEEFSVEHEFKSMVLPQEAITLNLQPESWSSFKIEDLADHGTKVSKDGPLVKFEKESYERQLEDMRRSVATSELELANKQLEYDKLKELSGIQLEAARRASKVAAEELDYFEKIGRPATEKGIAQDLKMEEFRLESAKEELKQLKQMYDEDDLTEETEEIILKRQQFSVEGAEFSYEEAKRSAQSKLEFSLPRRHAELKKAASEAAISLIKAEANLPRSIQTAEIEMEGAKANLDRKKLELQRLESDKGLLGWQAPSSGTLIYGAIEDGAWQLNDLAKVLREGSSVPTERTILSFIPEDQPVTLSAHVDSATAHALKPGLNVSVTVAGREDLNLTGSIQTISPVADLGGRHTVTIGCEWPDELGKPWTSQVNCRVISYVNPEALAVPKKALRLDADGSWTVEVKLADGKTQKRTVKLGRVTDKAAEVVSGLEPGQVIITPDK